MNKIDKKQRNACEKSQSAVRLVGKASVANILLLLMARMMEKMKKQQTSFLAPQNEKPIKNFTKFAKTICRKWIGN